MDTNRDFDLANWSASSKFLPIPPFLSFFDKNNKDIGPQNSQKRDILSIFDLANWSASSKFLLSKRWIEQIEVLQKIDLFSKSSRTPRDLDQ